MDEVSEERKRRREFGDETGGGSGGGGGRPCSHVDWVPCVTRARPTDGTAIPLGGAWRPREGTLLDFLFGRFIFIHQNTHG